MCCVELGKMHVVYGGVVHCELQAISSAVGVHRYAYVYMGTVRPKSKQGNTTNIKAAQVRFKHMSYIPLTRQMLYSLNVLLKLAERSERPGPWCYKVPAHGIISSCLSGFMHTRVHIGVWRAHSHCKAH